jgi:hypothetical protein
MTIPEEGRTPTALDLLFGPHADAAETLAAEIASAGRDQNLGRALAHLPEATREAAVREAAATAAALLKVDLVGVLVRGWSGRWPFPAAPNWSACPPTKSGSSSAPP